MESYNDMKIFDHDADYTDEEYREFFNQAELDDEIKKAWNKFFYGDVPKKR